tara:strand:- start:6244 stop:6780 length:537 start_codon:yes stop_codon:yes gene_type:complete
MILGIDVSTSITGFAVLDCNNDLIDTRSCSLKKYSNIFEKAEAVAKILKEYKNTHNIEKIYIEQSLFMFMSGRSSAKTISLLSRFNGIVSWLCYDIYKIEPEYVSAASARKRSGIKIPRGQKAKEVVLNYLLDNEPNFVIEYTRNGNPKPESYDRADSIIVARAGYSIEQERKIKDPT